MGLLELQGGPDCCLQLGSLGFYTERLFHKLGQWDEDFELFFPAGQQYRTVAFNGPHFG